MTDDPRVLAFAQARQRMGHAIYGVTGHWDNLTPSEQRLFTEESATWLQAAEQAGILPPPDPEPLTTEQRLHAYKTAFVKAGDSFDASSGTNLYAHLAAAILPVVGAETEFHRTNYVETLANLQRSQRAGERLRAKLARVTDSLNEMDEENARLRLRLDQLPAPAAAPPAPPAAPDTRPISVQDLARAVDNSTPYPLDVEPEAPHMAARLLEMLHITRRTEHPMWQLEEPPAPPVEPSDPDHG